MKDHCNSWFRDIYEARYVISLPEENMIGKTFVSNTSKFVNGYYFEVCKARLNFDWRRFFLSFYASNMLLQQQCKERNFTTFFNFIITLLLVEKHNSLLMMIHQAHPTNSKTLSLLEASAGASEAQTINISSVIYFPFLRRFPIAHRLGP